jgi:hypothetical protein
MSDWIDEVGGMQALSLDADTADRLLAGRVDPDDAPPGYADAVTLLQAASAAANREELIGEAETVAVMAAAVRDQIPEPVPSPRRSHMSTRYLGLKMAAAIAIGMLGAGTALAAAGVLPGQASGVARDAIKSGGSASTGQSDSHPAFATTPGRAGTRVSRLALHTRATGVDKGARISTVASGGMSQAGEHGSAAGDNGAAGLDTANDASDGASHDGLATARAARRGDVPPPPATNAP